MPPRPSMMPPITRCRACPATFALTTTPLTDLDACFAELLAAGWLHFARAGQGRHKWAWECATCEPTHKPLQSSPAPFSLGPKNEMRRTVEELSGSVAVVAKEKGLVNTRIGSKVSARGELVIALIIPPKYPGEWEP